MKILGYVLVAIVLYAIYWSFKNKVVAPGAGAATLRQTSTPQNPDPVVLGKTPFTILPLRM